MKKSERRKLKKREEKILERLAKGHEVRPPPIMSASRLRTRAHQHRMDPREGQD